MSFAYVDQFEVAALKAPASGAQQPQPQPIVDAAHTIVNEFAQPERTQSRTLSIWKMAQSMDVAGFQTAMERALKMAAERDSLPIAKGGMGWVPPAGATGRAKYGPMQSSLATLASQCRQVFGACKIDPESIVSAAPDGQIINHDLFPNWTKAYEKAHNFLKEKGVDWTGNTLSDKEQARKNKKASADDAEIEAAVKAQHPKAMGESLADYNTRIAPFMDEAEVDFRAKRTQSVAEKELTRLIKVYGDDVADILEAMVARYNVMADGEEAPQ